MMSSGKVLVPRQAGAERRGGKEGGPHSELRWGASLGGSEKPGFPGGLSWG